MLKISMKTVVILVICIFSIFPLSSYSLNFHESNGNHLKEEKSKLKAFPFPSQNIISIIGLPNDVQSIELLDGLGNVVLKVFSNFNSISVIDLPTGLYDIKVNISNNETKKTDFLKLW